MANPTNKYNTVLGLQQPSASDLTDGTTGTGAVVEAGSPALTGIPTAPTASPGTNTTQLATTAFVEAAVGGAFSNPMTTLGDIIYENATPAPDRLAGNTTTTKEYLSQTGTGSASAAPIWNQPAAADLSNGTSGSGAVALVGSPALTGSPTAPTASAGDNSTKLATTAFVQTAAFGGGTNPFSARTWRRKSWATANGTSTTADAFGDPWSANFSGGGTGANAAANANPWLPNIGGNASNATAGFFSGTQCMVVGKNINIALLGNLNRITNARYWFGVTDQTGSTMGGSDNPAGNYAAFRFSTIASDTAWQAITKDGTTQNIIATGVSATTNQNEFSIIFNDATPNVQFYINGVLVATSALHLPAVGSLLRWVQTTTTTVNNTSAGCQFVQVYTEQDAY